MRLATISLAVHLLACAASDADEFRIEGLVVDARGKPVQRAMVSPFWRANGSFKLPNGKDYDLNDKDQNATFWGNVGDMEPWMSPVETAIDGTFSMTLPVRYKHLLAMDATRTFGGIVEIPNRVTTVGEVEICLRPLVRVVGQMKSVVPGKTIDWSHVYVELVADRTKPLAMRRVVSCGSYESRFEFRLPPGRYRLDIYGNSDRELEHTDLQVKSIPVLTIDGTQREMDMGIIELENSSANRAVLEKAAKDEGRWWHYREHYGEPAPEWHAVDARGISKQTTISDFRGKWLVIYFWGLGCPPCLANGIPKMMEFYDTHSDQKDRFEIVAVCIDIHDEIADLKELDAALAPIITHVWQGRKIDYPIVLDNTFQTWERYGIRGLGDLVLVDPDGNIFEGDDATLHGILSGDAEPRDATESSN